MNGITPLHLAAYHGHLPIVQLLVGLLENKNPKAGIYWQEITPLHDAALGGHLDVLQFLLQFNEQDTNPAESDGKTCLHLAAQNGHLNIIKYYKEELNYENINPRRVSKDEFNGWTSLQVVMYIFEGEKNPQNTNGVTPLHLAAENGHLEIVEFLTARIEDKNPSDDNGMTPLHDGARFGHLPIVQHLVRFLANKNPKAGRQEITPLHEAALGGHLDVLQFLLQFNEQDTNPAMSNGKTSLHLAAQNE